MEAKPLYFDFNATTPIDPQVLDQLPQWLEPWGNPSSIHGHGRRAKKLLQQSRRGLAQVLGVHPLEVIFTSGGSESNNLALQGSLQEIKKREPHRNRVLLGAMEHPSILQQREVLEAMGFEVLKIPVNLQGEYDLDFYGQALNEKTALVSVMLANNEIGVLAPLQEMAEKAKTLGAFFHSDMVQGLGKIPFSLETLRVDMASFSSHKIYAMKGAGALYVKKGTPFSSLTRGGSQERGRRAGTENLAAIASFAFMADQINPLEVEQKLKPLRDGFEAWITKHIAGVSILGQGSPRLPNTSCFLVDSVSGESLLMNLDIRGHSVGTGAACSSGNPEPSPVLLALGLSRSQAQSSLRISLGKETTEDQLMSLAENLKEVVEYLRGLNSMDEALSPLGEKKSFHTPVRKKAAFNSGWTHV